MRKIQLIFSPYELKLLKPLQTSNGKILSRRGIIIKLKTESGHTGIGDICPFPEYGSETFEEAEKFIGNFSHKISFNIDDIGDSLQETFSDIPDYPAVKCGLEQAILSVIADENNLSLNYLLNQKSRSLIHVNALIGLKDPAASARTAEKFIKEGYNTIKVKIGRKNFRDDLACLKSISKVTGERIKLRLDVNGKWNSSEAREYLPKLEEFNIEYIEQPVSAFKAFVEISGVSKIPLAADESVRTFEDAFTFIKSRAVSFLVLKPMMLGGIIPVLKIYNEASKNGIGIVVTSSLESSIGRGYAVFAASLIKEDIAHGLSMQGYFESQYNNTVSYSVRNGVIHL